MFEHRGIKSKLNFSQAVKCNFIKIIDFLFEEYKVCQIDGEIKLLSNGNPSCSPPYIYVAPTGGCLSNYYQLSFQLSHELTHLIQYHQKRGLPFCYELDTNGNCTQKPFPNHSCQETEAIANSVDLCENVLKLEGYNVRGRENPDYYDYDEAFKLVDTGTLQAMRQKYNTYQS